MKTEQRAAWLLTPHDGFFAKDGRGWYAGSSGTGVSLDWPLPQTVRGALVSGIGFAHEQVRAGLLQRQDWLDLKDRVSLAAVLAVRARVGARAVMRDRMWPAPADALCLESSESNGSTLWRLVPEPSESSDVKLLNDTIAALEWLSLPDDCPERDAKPLTMPRWWTEEEFVAWLCGRTPRLDTDDDARHPTSRMSVHVKMDVTTGTADPGKLWVTDAREAFSSSRSPGKGRSTWAWHLLVGMNLDDDGAAAPPFAYLGGDRQLLDVSGEDSTQGLLDCPGAIAAKALSGTNIRRIAIYAITPVIYEAGWQPDFLVHTEDGLIGDLPLKKTTNESDAVRVRLVSCSVPRPLAISGWDMQAAISGAPRTTVYGNRPGSVWLFEPVDAESFPLNILERLWLHQLGNQKADGYGVVVAGICPTP